MNQGVHLEALSAENCFIKHLGYRAKAQLAQILFAVRVFDLKKPLNKSP